MAMGMELYSLEQVIRVQEPPSLLLHLEVTLRRPQEETRVL